MSKLRIYELAKEKKLSTKELMWTLEKIGIKVKSHMSTLSIEDYNKLDNYLNNKKQVTNTDNSPKKMDVKEEKTINENNTNTTTQPQAVNLNKNDKPVNKNTFVDEEKDYSKSKKPFPKKKKPENKNNNDFKNKKNRKKNINSKNQFVKPDSPVIKKIVIGESITVQEFAKRIGKTAAEVIRNLIKSGVMVTLNEEIDFDTASLIAEEYGIETEFKSDKPVTELEEIIDEVSSLKERPPVVTVMGHVDHGKTSLLDALRHSKVTETEAGGITQHIGAYQIVVNDRKVTFLDTPGHEAFTAMRARGAQATDIAILVVAADDGVMPQTIEAINHSKAAGVPIIVAVNKIDKEEANPDRVKQQLSEHGLIPEEWSGDTIYVPVSAKKAMGIDQLLEMILLVADMSELKANANRNAEGVVIEAKLDKGRGPVATVLVQKGTLNVGDILIAGSIYGKVRAMLDDKGNRTDTAGPSVPVEVLGFSNVPEAGDIFQVVTDEKLAKDIVEQRNIIKRESVLHQNAKVSLDDLFKNVNNDEQKELNVVIKADVQGSIEALKQSLTGLDTDEVKVNLIHGGVGAVNESDVLLASASNAVIVAFNVRPDVNATKAAEKDNIEIRSYNIIYDVIDDIKIAMSGLLEPEYKEEYLGRAEVRDIFKVPRIGVIAGAMIIDGKFTNKSKVRLLRENAVIYEGNVDSLKRFKDDVKEVAQGYECGIGLENYNDIKVGDIIEAFIMKEIKRKL